MSRWFPKTWNTKILSSCASKRYHEEEAASHSQGVLQRVEESLVNLVFSREASVSFKSVMPAADPVRKQA